MARKFCLPIPSAKARTGHDRPQPNRFLEAELFGSVPENKVRFKRPEKRIKEINPKKKVIVNVTTPRNLKKVSTVSTVNTNLFDDSLVVGNIVEHAKFGKGEVGLIEGVGNSKKAEINFESGATKKLLLHFAKLKIIG